MPDEEIEQIEDSQDEAPAGNDKKADDARRPFFTRRRLGLAAGIAAIAVVLLAALAAVMYRTGVFDSYIREQFRAKMEEIGVVFDADVFRITVNPLELELRNATFNDKVSGEKLFFIRYARLELTVPDLFAWQLSRDISIDTTEINGAEAWIKFDENGVSNFANLTFVDDQPGGRVNFKYQSMKFTLRDSVVHFNDLSRKITADANNLVFLLEPESYEVPDEQKRYKFDLSSTDSRFVYGDSPLTPVDIRAVGIADGTGADITEFKLSTPIGESTMNGRITDWAAFKYDLTIESTVDLTQTSNIFPLGTTLRGVGNFKGKVTGEGTNYNVTGVVDSQALSAEGIYLKAVNVNATVAGTNSAYEANGTAIAELLTFEDFRIEFPKLTGNVRGTGTDFRWVGELQAAAASSDSLSLAGLFLDDAVAEYKENELTASSANGRARRFSVGDTEFANLRAGDLRFALRDGNITLTAPGASADSFATEDYALRSIRSGGIKVTSGDGRTDIDVKNVRADSANVSDTRLSDVTADEFRFTDHPNSIELEARNLRAARLDANGTIISGLEAPSISLVDTAANTVIYSDRVRIAKVDAEAATLGTLNIGGVRLTIKQGRVEGRSDDIDAGDVTLAANSAMPNGGIVSDVKLAKPVFILEPSGRYRVTADMSLGGGTIGSVPLGAANAKVEVNNDRVELNELVANVMEGVINGEAAIAFSERNDSIFRMDFTGLDLSKVAALQGGRVIPLEGRMSGDVDLTMAGTDHTTTSGTVNADITATATDAANGSMPINGNVRLSATNGLFNVDLAKLMTERTELFATGRFDLRNVDSNLDVTLASTDASEVDRLFRVFGISPEVENRLDSMQAEFAGDLRANVNITGNLSDPVIDGNASLEALVLRGREVGSVSTDVSVDPTMIKLTNGKITERAGGTIDFNVNIPSFGANNIAVHAELNNVNAGNLLSALPVELPGQLSDFTGSTSGTVDLKGLPNASSGTIDIDSTSGTIGGQSFDSLSANAVFNGTRIDIEQVEIRIGDGFASVKGMYDMAETTFDLDLEGKDVPLALVASMLPQSSAIPTVGGLVDITAEADGRADRPSSFVINFNGVAKDVMLNGNSFGTMNINGETRNSVLDAAITMNIDNRPQVINASVNFGDERMPFSVRHTMENSAIGPFFALIPQLQGIEILGNATGTLELAGDLASRDAAGNIVYSADGLSGSARFSSLELSLEGTPLVATQPVVVLFNTREIIVESANFSGGGSNVTIAGTKALLDSGTNSLTVEGRINLSLLNVIPQIAASDTFFAGFADVSMNLAGLNRTARLSGTANISNASIATFIGSDRLTFDRLDGRILFTSNQIQIEEASGYLGGGQFVATGGALLANDLSLTSYRLNLDGTNVTMPLPEDFITTGDVQLEISGRRFGGGLSTLIAGTVRARRSVYSTDIDLANIVGSRGDGSLSGGASSLRAPRFDLIIEGRDALIVRNNIADLTASASLRLTGTTDNPQLSGRVTATSGTVFFRRDRYDVQRLVLEFPPNTAIEPVISLQAETVIQGYQIYVNVSGSLTDTETLNASVRSSPALPQADVISLVTTGSLSNTESGIPTLASTGINTVAEVLTDSIINNPARKATDKLFGLNVFEIDPVISGETLNPSARLTVGRQINNNLRVTYATNLSQDQNQVLAFEYRVSNRLSFVAMYEQRPLTNVTGDRNNFSFEFRFRKRF